jgi:NADPH:quinone reductase-like Zn-dependent oxidoreductase
MKAYEIHEHTGPGGLQIVEREQPVPGPGQILVRVHAVSLNYRDLVIARTEGISKRNVVPLSDGAGEVLQVGAGVQNFEPGDRVAGNFFQSWPDGPIRAEVFSTAMGGSVDGTLREYVVLHADSAVKIPSFYSYEEAATLPCAAVTVWNALVEVGQAKPGEVVVLLGTGGVSIFGLQLAKILGLRSIITSSSDEKLERARSLGANETINYKINPDWEKAVWDLTGKIGADHVLEVGGAGTLPRSFRAVRPGGTVQLTGILTGANEINPMPVLHKVLNLRGVYVGSTRMFREMVRAIELHGLRPVIDRVFDFDQVPEAYEYMNSGGHFGKIVVRVNPE